MKKYKKWWNALPENLKKVCLEWCRYFLGSKETGAVTDTEIEMMYKDNFGDN